MVSDGKKKFMARFHELTDYYEKLHEEHEYKPYKVSTNTFYSNFLRKYDDLYKNTQNSKIKAIMEKLRKKAEILSEFNQRKSMHDLAEKTVDRLTEIGMELYALPDIDYVLESSREIEMKILLACCPEFTHKEHKDGQCLYCKGTLKKVKFPMGEDLQTALRLYYEKYCSHCDHLHKVEEEIVANRLNGENIYELS